MEHILSINNLNKRYGSVHAVKDLSIQVPPGSIYGILGPNGSGKSTTLGISLGIVNADSGSFNWFGQGSVDANRKKVGAILEKPNFYPYLSGLNNLRITSKIKGTNPSEIDGVLEEVGLLDRKTSRFKAYSTGMKQRLAIAAALLGDPQVLVLDEPTNGLDPQGIVDIRNLIIQLGERGKTIVLASHILDEVEKVCSHVAILQKGALKAAGSVAEVLSGDGNTIVLVGSSDLGKLESALKAYPNFLSLSPVQGKLLVVLKGEVNPGQLNSYLFEKGISADHVALKQKTLEESFLEITSG